MYIIFYIYIYIYICIIFYIINTLPIESSTNPTTIPFCLCPPHLRISSGCILDLATS